MDVSIFLATMVALSVAVERIVEILKEMLGGLPGIRLLFNPARTQAKENVRCALLHLFSATVGGILAGVSNINILPKSHHLYLSYALAGLLSSGGSAFWNHALDIMQAAKVERQQRARMLLKANAAAPVMEGLPSES